jgi:hypothetical protein
MLGARSRAVALDDTASHGVMRTPPSAKPGRTLLAVAKYFNATQYFWAELTHAYFWVTALTY